MESSSYIKALNDFCSDIAQRAPSLPNDPAVVQKLQEAVALLKADSPEGNQDGTK